MYSDLHLSDRDRLIIEAVTVFKQLTGTQIERLFFSDGAPASRTGKRNRILRRLVEWKEIGRIEERALGGWNRGSHGYVYIPPDHDPQLRDTHTLNIAELYIRLTETKQLELVDYRPEASITGLSVVPDADVRVRINGRLFRFYAEVEYAAKSDERVKTKIRAFERAARGASRFPLVLFLANNPTRLGAIRRVIAQSSFKEIFEVILFDDAVPYLLSR
jgi:hypothetical protein